MSDSDSQLFQLKAAKDIKMGDVFIGANSDAHRVTSDTYTNEKTGCIHFKYVSLDPPEYTYVCDNPRKKILVRLS